jgi:CHAD domain-containing protein
MRDGADEEAIHDARVALRRLEAAAGTFRDCLGRDARRELLELLREWRRRLGRARDHEVLAAGLTEPEHLDIGGDDARALADEQLALRDEARADAARWAKPARERRLEQALRPLLALADRAQQEDALADGERRCARRETKARACLADAAGSDDDEVLHDARIALRRWRYAIEALEPFARGPGAPARKALRVLQRELGTVHDRAVLRDLLLAEARRAGKAKPRPLGERAEAFSAIAARAEAQRLEALGRFRSRLSKSAWRDAPNDPEQEPTPSPASPRARRGRSRR